MIRPYALPCLLASACLAAPAATKADTDRAIEAAARRSYNFRVHLKGDAIHVVAKGGDVTLTGTVADPFHKSLAEETVLGLRGVKSVDNRLVPREQAPSAPSDPWLATSVKNALRFHRNVDASATHVEARGGVVTLSGDVSSAAQKELTADIARNVEGVTEVKNDLKVVGTAAPKPLAVKIDDASLTAQVKAVLLAHRGTRMLATKVKTDRGVVTLGGEARNAVEKDLAQRLAAGVKGVKRVDNRMTVQ
jgi:osmotically-inducible protein OsmY